MADNGKIDLAFLGLGDEDDEDDAGDLLAFYYSTVASGPMTSYRRIRQSGKHQGQSYYMHVLDGVNVLHKLRVSGILELTDLEERLLFAAYTIHDINKIELYNARDSRAKYADIATSANIRAELTRLNMSDFFPDWEDYLEEIKWLAHFHQHDSAPLCDLNRSSNRFKIDRERLDELGPLMQGLDNLDLSQDLAETTHKAEFQSRVESASARHLRWVTHRLGENRGLLTNLIHNVVVAYLRERHTHEGRPLFFADLLFYPEGVAYLLSEREPFTWTPADTEEIARRVAHEVDLKKASAYKKFIRNTKDGIKVDRAAVEGGATFEQIMDVIYSIAERKTYKEQDHDTYLGKLLSDLEDAAAQQEQPFAAAAQKLLDQPAPIIPLAQDTFRRGALAYAYRNLLENHLKPLLKGAPNSDPWERVYLLMELPADDYPLYNQVFATRRGPLLAHNSTVSFDMLFECMNDDLKKLRGDAASEVTESADFGDFLAYLQNNLEVNATVGQPNFKANLHQYVTSNHKQCGTCSAGRPTGEWMSANAPSSLTVQFFSNRLEGGSARDPKRNVCAVCRAEFILEKLAWPSHDDKHGGKYTTFYLHLYPYAFFTAPYLDAMKNMFGTIRLESRSADADAADQPVEDIENRSLLFDTLGYLSAWHEQYDSKLGSILSRRVSILATPKKLNGVGRSEFSESLGNTPTMPLTAPGDNYGKQFIFALTHALMVADLFACRVVLSRTPTPLFTGEYLHQHQLSFFADGIPRSLRWLLPTDGYRSIETYRDVADKQEYARRKDGWSNEPPDQDGYMPAENIVVRLGAIDHLSRQVSSKDSHGLDNNDDLLLDLATAAADDPFAVYYVADRAIEQKVHAKGDRPGKAGAPAKTNPEQHATYLSKQVVGLLDKIAKEYTA
ncbi:MAG: type I-D CRISPR-associated protein Cas10d/Csc3 [Chloroflexia bacterium]